MPGDRLQHILLIHAHGVRDLRAEWVNGALIQGLDDGTGRKHLRVGLSLVDRLREVIIRPVPVGPQGVELGARRLNGRLTSIE